MNRHQVPRLTILIGLAITVILIGAVMMFPKFKSWLAPNYTLIGNIAASAITLLAIWMVWPSLTRRVKTIHLPRTLTLNARLVPRWAVGIAGSLILAIIIIIIFPGAMFWIIRAAVLGILILACWWTKRRGQIRWFVMVMAVVAIVLVGTWRFGIRSDSPSLSVAKQAVTDATKNDKQDSAGQLKPSPSAVKVLMEMKVCDDSAKPVEIQTDSRGEMRIDLIEACFGPDTKFPAPLATWTIIPISAQGEFWISLWPQGQAKPSPVLRDTTEVGGSATIARFRGRGSLLFQTKGQIPKEETPPAQPRGTNEMQIGLAKFILPDPHASRQSPGGPPSTGCRESELATEHNNPYGIKLYPFVREHGGTDSGRHPTDGGPNFAHFPNRIYAHDTIMAVWLTPKYQKLTVDKALYEEWSGHGYGGNEVLGGTSIDPQMMVSRLSPNQLEELLGVIQHKESCTDSSSAPTPITTPSPFWSRSSEPTEEEMLERRYPGYSPNAVPCDGTGNTETHHENDTADSFEVTLRSGCFSAAIFFPRDWQYWTLGPKNEAGKDGWIAIRQEGDYSPRPGGPYPLSHPSPTVRVEYGHHYPSHPAIKQWLQGEGTVVFFKQ